VTDAEYLILEECLDGYVDCLGVRNAVNRLLGEKIDLIKYKGIVERMVKDRWVETDWTNMKATKLGRRAYENGSFV
jgi:predicted nucleotidyltransferase